MSTNYQVIVKGLGIGQSKANVAAKLAPLLNISSDEAFHILNEPNPVVKRGVDFQTAVKYVEALENCGCDCEVKPESNLLEEVKAETTISSKTLIEVAENAYSIQALAEPNPLYSTESKPTPERPLTTNKLSRNVLIIISGALMVTAVAAVTSYKLLKPEESTDIKPQPSLAVLPVVENNVKQQNSGVIGEGDRVDKAHTVAGEIAVIKIGDYQALSLNGKIVYHQQDFSFSIWKAFSFPGKTVLLLENGGMGTSCPAKYRFITVKKDGQVAYTDEIGSCSDMLEVTVLSDSITIIIQDIRGAGEEAWTYANESITQVKYIDPNIEINAPKLASDEAVQVRGRLKKADGKNWLVLPHNVSVCNRITDTIEAAWDDSLISPYEGEKELIGTIECFGVGPYIYFGAS